MTLVLPALVRNSALCRGILGTEVATQGSGPCDEDDFDSFLSECGISLRTIRGDYPPDVVVLGREGWVSTDLDLLETDGRDQARVYSQEMVLASMAIGADILELLGSDLLDSHTQEVLMLDHPALKYIYLGDFSTAAAPSEPPVSTDVTPTTLIVNFDAGEWPSSGVLSQMGYHVGQSGLVAETRRAILKRVLSVELVAATPDTLSYIAEWGPPLSRQRLQKMFNCLTGFSRAARRRPADCSEAIADWESDIQWLRNTFGG